MAFISAFNKYFPSISSVLGTVYAQGSCRELEMVLKAND